MISRLFARDFAILDELVVDFSPGLTVITGETGSGKSIMLQALNVALGGKVHKNMIRSNQSRSTVEVEIGNAIYRRILKAKGRIRSFHNDEPQNESKFKSVTASLVDFHGQHEQQLIMNRTSHIRYLDSYCTNDRLLEEIETIYNQIIKIQDIIEEKKSLMRNAGEKKELIKFQLQEIIGVDPQVQEDGKLEEQFQILSHIDELIKTVENVNRSFIEDDEGVYNKLIYARQDLLKLVKYDQQIESFVDSLNSAAVNIQDLTSGLYDHIQSINHDKKQLLTIQERLNALDSLKRKYGGSIQSVIETKLHLEQELKELTVLDDSIDNLENTLFEITKKYQKLASELHFNRANSAGRLSKEVENEMKYLHMPGATFNIRISQKSASNSFAKFEDQNVQAFPNGIDIIEFYLSANPGELQKPLVDIASGGEISRIMLAIKAVLQNNDPVNSLVFDEIDTGISGTAAVKVAESLKRLANSKQVICITHLPQIALVADHHLHVDKNFSKSQTYVNVRYLKGNESKEIIGQLSGNTE
jgi:DNA repair protein RecN (Recombination protein N)